MKCKAILLQVSFGTLAGAMEEHVGGNKTRFKLDPCEILCNANGCDGCGISKSVSGECQGLFRDELGNIAYSNEPKPSWTGVSTDEARAILSTQTQSCGDICDQVEDCPASYCKQNNHCHGLFWSDVTKREACFYTDEKPCKTKIPVLCVHEETTPTATASVATTEVKDDIAIESPTQSEDILKTESVTYDAVADNNTDTVDSQASSMQGNETPAMGDSDGETSHSALPQVPTVSRSISSTTPHSPVKANQNDTQSSKSSGALGVSAGSGWVVLVLTAFVSFYY